MSCLPLLFVEIYRIYIGHILKINLQTHIFIVPEDLSSLKAKQADVVPFTPSLARRRILLKWQVKFSSRGSDDKV